MSNVNGKEEYSSDTLERSNVSSLQTDVSSMNHPLEMKNDGASLKNLQSCFCPQHSFNKIKFFPCPLLNSNIEQAVFNHPCPCQQFLKECEFRNKKDEVLDDINSKWSQMNWKWPKQSFLNKKDKSYDTSKSKKNLYEKKPFVCCDFLEGIPKNANYDFKNIIENPIKHEFDSKDNNDITEKIEIYYFDHGNAAYYHTTDIPPILTSEKFAEKSNSAITRFWAEIFGYLHILTSLLTSFILQLFRCILFTLIRPLIVGMIQLLGDYLIKPLLSITFNGIIQPILILFYNVATSFRDCCEPLATALGFYVKEIAVLLRSCRLIEISYHQKSNVTT